MRRRTWLSDDPAKDALNDPAQVIWREWPTHDGYIVNAIIDACYKSAQTKQWEPVQLDVWRGSNDINEGAQYEHYNEQYYLIKTEILPDERKKIILKDKTTGEITQKVIDKAE